MRSICLCFHVHQPVRLKKFTFFDIGNAGNYYDDSSNETILKRLARNCYLPANKIILDLIEKSNSRFKVAYSISGTALDLMALYIPEVIESFQKLAATGCVEFLAQTYSHSLSGLRSKYNFKKQVELHAKRIESLFGRKPEVFANTGLIYSDEIGARVAAMGFKAMLCGSSKHILQWRSPNFVYRNASNTAFSVLLKNQPLSDDVALRFSNKEWVGYPLNTKKYVSWLNKSSREGQIINLFMDYETFGEYHKMETGIFDFLQSLPSAIYLKPGFRFFTPSEVVELIPPTSTLHVPFSHIWGDSECNLSSCLGNELQQEAFEQLYSLSSLMEYCTDPALVNDWLYLQSCDHFSYMATDNYPSTEGQRAFNPYNSPYDAFINYMNVLNDFIIRLKKCTEEPRLQEYEDKKEALIYTFS